MIGHKLSVEEIAERVNGFWDLSGDFPVPRESVLCPVCRASEVIIKDYRFFKKDGRESYRCDVVFKCCICSAAWLHGVVVPKEYAKKHVADGVAKTYWWKDIIDNKV